MVDLIEQSRLAVDELLDVAGRATIETVLQLSAEQLAGATDAGAATPATAVARPASGSGVSARAQVRGE